MRLPWGRKALRPYRSEITIFAKDITTRTANRIAQHVNQVRNLTTLDESEKTVTHEFDNRNGSSNMRGIYRWVNKVYQAHLVNYGHRLMIEFIVPKPADSYIKSEFYIRGLSFYEPTHPAHIKQKISSYKDITRKNYAELATLYGIQPPPIEFKIITATFQSNKSVNIEQLSVPQGYRAKNAAVTYIISGNSNLDLVGLVGQNLFTVPASLNPPIENPRMASDSESHWSCEPKSVNSDGIHAGTQCFLMNFEDSTVQVAVTCKGEEALLSLSPPGSYNSYFVNVEIQCCLADEKFEEWQIEAYNAIMNAHRKQKAEYYNLTGTNKTKFGSRNPVENRNIEKRELKKDCIKQLLEQQLRLSGDAEDGEFSVFDFHQPRYIQFLEHTFEWDEMTYHFYPHLRGEEEYPKTILTALNQDLCPDPLFTSFLQAGLARVLVPVRPDYKMIVLYYLSSGLIWTGASALTPTTEKYVSLVNELKILSHVKHENKTVSEPWEIKIPTSMIMLQDHAKFG